MQRRSGRIADCLSQKPPGQSFNPPGPLLSSCLCSGCSPGLESSSAELSMALQVFAQMTALLCCHGIYHLLTYYTMCLLVMSTFIVCFSPPFPLSLQTPQSIAGSLPRWPQCTHGMGSLPRSAGGTCKHDGLSLPR